MFSPCPTSLSSIVQLFSGLQNFSFSLSIALAEAVSGMIFISAFLPFFSLSFSFVLALVVSWVRLQLLQLTFMLFAVSWILFFANSFTLICLPVSVMYVPAFILFFIVWPMPWFVVFGSWTTFVMTLRVLFVAAELFAMFVVFVDRTRLVARRVIRTVVRIRFTLFIGLIRLFCL